MKLSHFVIGACLAFTAVSSFALTPPKYLSVPNWQQCVSATTKGSAQYICLPDVRPDGCPKSSWKKLKRHHLVDKCSKNLIQK